jgi:predicted metal-binding membrane protein
MRAAAPIEAVLRRDRLAVVAGLVLVIAAAWAYILAGAGMGATGFEMTAMPTRWNAGTAVLMLAMWWIMMAAMMLPSAAPMVLLFAAINRRQRARQAPFTATGFFLCGYLLAWGGFSLVAVGLQWLFARTELLSPTMQSTSAVLGGGLIILAGLWQLSPLKHACLRHCRAPAYAISQHWRRGRLGALRMGLGHGAFCLGCCWFLMGLLFYGGVMNLYWIIGLAVYVMLEKLAPAGHRLALLIGPALIACGALVIAAAV